MIVRGSVLSEKRVTLESALAERPAVAPIRAVSSFAPDELVAREPAGATMPAALAAVPPSGLAMQLATVSGAPALATPLASVSGAPTPATPLASVSGMSAVPATPAVAPPPPISFDAVAKWLATQDPATRTRLAGLLTDDIGQIRSAAREEGWQAGHDAGLAEAAAESERLLALLAEITAVAQAALAEDSAKLADQCAEIVAAALARIAGAKLVTQKAALGVVNEILKRVTDEHELIVRVSAADLPGLQEQKEKLGAAVAGRALTLVADPRVQLGGAMVESKLGSLDGRLEVQLRGLFDTLQAAKSAPKDAS
jgi:flagellar biosynthesis/type III secretory pathway protein FliH